MENKIKSQQEIIKELEDKITANMEEIEKVLHILQNIKCVHQNFSVFSCQLYSLRLSMTWRRGQLSLL